MANFCYWFSGKGHDLVILFNAAREKIMQESVTLSSVDDPTMKIVLELHARVLGKHI